MKGRIACLGDYVTVLGGGTPSRKEPDYFSGNIPWLTVKDFGGAYFVRDAREHISQAGLDSSASRLISKGNVILATRMAVGKAVLNQVDVAINQDLKALICAPTLDPTYLLFFLSSIAPKLEALANGSTVKGITVDDIVEMPVSFPDIDEQRRIAKLIEQADRLSRLRQFAAELSSTTLQSVFIEMFGDPMRNPMGWKTALLSDLGEMDRGRSKHRPRNDPRLYGGPYPFIQTGDVANCTIYIVQFNQTYSELGLRQSRLWKAGTLCITIAANIANTGILGFDSCFPDSVVGFTPNEKTTVEYIHFWFGFAKQMLERIAPESAQKNINLEILRELPVTVPPIAIQRKFSQIVAKDARIRAKHQESCRQVDHIFQTVLNQSFSQVSKDIPADLVGAERR